MAEKEILIALIILILLALFVIGFIIAYCKLSKVAKDITNDIEIKLEQNKRIRLLEKRINQLFGKISKLNK